MSESDSDRDGPRLPRLRLGGGPGGIDPDAVARAEAALKSLSANFGAWLEEEIVKLEAAGRTIREQGLTAEAGEGLYLRAHDLKGLGTTYEFPLISRIAASLCRLVEKPERRASAPPALIEAHIAAVRTAARDGIRTDTDPGGAALAQDLERRTNDHLAG